MEDAVAEKPAAAIPLQTLQAVVITLIYAILGDVIILPPLLNKRNGLIAIDIDNNFDLGGAVD